MVPVDQLYIGPQAATVFGWGGAFPAGTDGIATVRVLRQDGFKPEITHPMVNKLKFCNLTLQSRVKYRPRLL